ncbi:DEAD/DEAH box helicase family protein, partial [Candidatus Woesearchaeota archaeon]|nr:DEAD/DEAH box helicase family protein [Candidatus Woesearchaeota archaeon]
MFKTTPYKYQEKIIFDAYHSFLSHGHHAFLVEMGLGKTLMSLYASELLQRRGELDSIIIIPPQALVDVWVDEIPKHTYFEDNFYLWKNSKPIEKTEGLFPIIFINVEAFSRKNKYLKSFLHNHFLNYKTIVICDESTKIKNPKAQRTKNVLEYTSNAKYKAILTGTEITTSLLDLYTQYEFLKKFFWRMPNYWVFRSKYADLQKIKLAPVYNEKKKIWVE